jgi:hypothetical protein
VHTRLGEFSTAGLYPCGIPGNRGSVIFFLRHAHNRRSEPSLRRLKKQSGRAEADHDRTAWNRRSALLG